MLDNTLALVGMVGSTLIALGSLIITWYAWNRDSCDGMIYAVISLIISVMSLGIISDLAR